MKRERIYNLMKNLLDRGAPLYGFGMQNHYNIKNPTLDEVKKSIEMYASLGLRIHMTEMDINFYSDVHSNEKPIEITEEMKEKQNEIYVKLFELYRSYSDVIDSVTTWGVADDYSWLSRPNRPNYPLLFNADHSPKPCVYQMIEDATK
jgi:endo-1,4-beta-xylanase